jgi:alpha-1,2-mannosyltransferase
LILIGSTRHKKDKEYVEQLRILINDLNINNEVEFKLNITFKELKTQFDQAMIGLNATRNEDFGIGL